jgi:hypothetical protein
MAERESLGAMAVPGVTSVDPNLVRERDSLRAVMGVQRVQGGQMTIGTGIRALSVVAPPLALGLAAGTAAAYGVQLMSGGQAGASNAMEPSDAALAMARQLDREEGIEGTQTGGESSDSTPGQAAEDAPVPVMDPWSDLPPAPIDEQLAGTEFDPWAGQSADPWANQANDPWSTGGGPWSQDQSTDSSGSPEKPDHR